MKNSTRPAITASLPPYMGVQILGRLDFWRSREVYDCWAGCQTAQLSGREQLGLVGVWPGAEGGIAAQTLQQAALA